MLTPDDPPRHKPSSISSACNSGTDSQSGMLYAVSTCAPSKLAVMRLEPMPSLIELPSATSSPRLMKFASAEPAGSDSAMRTFFLRAFSPAATPASVPPVPAAHVKPSTAPSVSFQISIAVVAAWKSRLAVLSNWLANHALPGSCAFQVSASARAVCT